MRRPTLILAILLVTAATLHAQQLLSVDTGGLDACSQALHRLIPASNASNAEKLEFQHACLQRDFALEKIRFNALDEAFEKAPPDERVAYNALLLSFTGYREAYMSMASATCKPATCFPGDVEHARAVINEEFLLIAEGHPIGGIPSYTADDLTSADAALNTWYEKTLAALPVKCTRAAGDCPSQNELRDLQRDWIRYRDASVTFALLRWPNVTSESWLTLLTRQRNRSLAIAP